MVPKSDHLANTRFDKKPSAHYEDALVKYGMFLNHVHFQTYF